jgi:hypothetical protein
MTLIAYLDVIHSHILMDGHPRVFLAKATDAAYRCPRRARFQFFIHAHYAVLQTPAHQIEDSRKSGRLLNTLLSCVTDMELET